eukprot:TRINITY_DN6173_c1_g1_i2.p1 TRINITY_DN6173_c1_g1~~TRINITY_DN6173_c1_g1_i2.p1  ORF type:complete len:170 (-),score=24.73 TRINITY_DN6173_c1_g1_i2:279-788(-)
MTGSVDRALAEAIAPSLMHMLGHHPAGDSFSAVLPFATGSSRTSSGTQRAMPLDIFETKDAIEVHADVPGVAKSDIKIETDNGLLTLSVDRSAANDAKREEEGVKWHRSERSHYFVKRTMRLPEDADVENATAAYENGVLRVRVPKVEKQSKTKQIRIAQSCGQCRSCD